MKEDKETSKEEYESVEAFKNVLLSGDNLEVKLPINYLLFVLDLLDITCFNVLARMDEMKKKGISLSSVPPEELYIFSAPFLTRALIIEELVPMGIIQREDVLNKDLMWVKNVKDKQPNMTGGGDLLN